MQVEKYFKPELINRLSEIVIFEPLSHGQLRDIVRILMKSVIATVADKGVSVFASDTALDVIWSKSHSAVSICYLNLCRKIICYLKIIDLFVQLFICPKFPIKIYSIALTDVWCKAHKKMDQEKRDDCSCGHVGEWRSP
jgi:hypothetical protein